MNDIMGTKPTDERKEIVPVGADAPDFSVRASDGGAVSLNQFRGRKNVVLIFYPGDNTPVCTAQLCSFRDSWQGLEAADCVVFGVNPAGEAKHAGFAQKHALPFPLLIDNGGQMAAQYGCRAIFGIIRRTVYVIDKAGKIAYAKRGNPAPSEILQAVAPR